MHFRALRCDRLALSLFGGFRRRSGRLLHRCLRFQVKISPATVAKLNITVLHQSGDHANGQTHVAAGANLVADDSHTFFVPRAEPIIVAQDRIGNQGPKISDLFVIPFFFPEFNGLKFQQVLNGRIHTAN